MRSLLAVGALVFIAAVPADAQVQCEAQGVSLQVLGSGGPRAGTERASASYLVWIDGEARVMIDVGGGAFVRFGEAGASLATLDLIGISHFHPDHVTDLAGLLWLSDLARQDPLRISGPSGNGAFPSLDEHLLQLFDATTGAFRVLSGTLGGPGRGAPLEPNTVDVAVPDPVTVLDLPGLTVQALSVPHTNSPALAYRVESGGASIVFSSDQTGTDPRFIAFSRGVDLLVMHMAIPVGSTGPILDVHAAPARVGEIARDAGVGRLVLSHLLPGDAPLAQAVAEVQRRYRGTLDAASDLDCFRVG